MSKILSRSRAIHRIYDKIYKALFGIIGRFAAKSQRKKGDGTTLEGFSVVASSGAAGSETAGVAELVRSDLKPQSGSSDAASQGSVSCQRSIGFSSSVRSATPEGHSAARPIMR